MVIRMIDPGTEASYEVKVTDQDNGFSSLFFSNEISYIKVSWDKAVVLSQEEQDLWQLNEADEMTAESVVMDASVASSVLNKIDRAISSQIRTAMLEGLRTPIGGLQGDEAERNQRQVIAEYIGFSTSFNQAQGIIKAAETLKWKVQFVGSFY